MDIVWDKEFKLGVHVKLSTSGGDMHENNACIAVSYCTEKDHVVQSKSMTRKGFKTFLATRKISQDERDSEVPINPTRIKWTKYNSWDDMIKDEKQFHVSDEWIEKLEKLRKTYRSLDIKKIKGQLQIF